MLVAKLDASGAVDATFGDKGTSFPVALALGATSGGLAARSPDGKLVVAGKLGQGSRHFIARVVF